MADSIPPFVAVNTETLGNAQVSRLDQNFNDIQAALTSFRDVYNQLVTEFNAGGTDGGEGWSPLLGVVPDGDRRVVQLTGWENSAVPRPTLPAPLSALVGQYLGMTGFVSDIANATDVRGAVGPTGPQGDPGTSTSTVPGPRGPSGWSPVFSIIESGDGLFFRVANWTNPDTSQVLPANLQALIGFFVGATGFVNSVAAAVSVRGPAGIQGPQGTPGATGLQGPVGEAGWSPILSVQNDADRNVLQVSGWTNPNASLAVPSNLLGLVGQYISASGFTPTISQAADIRGQQGPAGQAGDAITIRTLEVFRSPPFSTATISTGNQGNAFNLDSWVGEETVLVDSSTGVSGTLILNLFSYQVDYQPTLGISYPFFIVITNGLGGLGSVGSINLRVATGESIASNRRLVPEIKLTPGQSIRLDYLALNAPPIAVIQTVPDSGQLTDSGIRFRPEEVDLSGSTIRGILTSTPVEPGDGFRVRVGADAFGDRINQGDVIVWLPPDGTITFNNSTAATNNEWIVIRGTDTHFINTQNLRFLAQWTEIDEEKFVRFRDGGAFSVWLSDAPFPSAGAAPFEDPSLDPDPTRGGVFQGNYVGGPNSFSVGSNLFGVNMTIRVVDADLTGIGQDLLRVVLEDTDNTVIDSWVLQGRFQEITTFTGGVAGSRYFQFVGLGSSPVTFNYIANATLRLAQYSFSFRFEANPTTVVLTPSDGTVTEATLSDSVRAKLEAETGGLGEDDAEKLKEIQVERGAGQTVTAGSITFLIHLGEPSRLFSDYRSSDRIAAAPDGPQTYAIGVSAQFSNPLLVGQFGASPSVILTLEPGLTLRGPDGTVYNVYRATIPADGFSVPGGFESYGMQGTVQVVSAIAPQPPYKIRANVLDEDVRALIADAALKPELPETLALIGANSHVQSLPSAGGWRVRGVLMIQNRMFAFFKTTPATGTPHPLVAESSIPNEIEGTPLATDQQMAINASDVIGNIEWPRELGGAPGVIVDIINTQSGGALDGPGFYDTSVTVINTTGTGSPTRDAYIVMGWMSLKSTASPNDAVGVVRQEFLQRPSPATDVVDRIMLGIDPTDGIFADRQVSPEQTVTTDTVTFLHSPGHVTDEIIYESGTPFRGAFDEEREFEIGQPYTGDRVFTVRIRYEVNGSIVAGSQFERTVTINGSTFTGTGFVSAATWNDWNPGPSFDSNRPIEIRVAQRSDGNGAIEVGIDNIDGGFPGPAERLFVSVRYTAVNTEVVPAQWTHDILFPGPIVANRRMRFAMVVRENEDASTNVIAEIAIANVNGDGAVDLARHEYGVSASRFQWARFRVGAEHLVMTNLQGGIFEALNTNDLVSPEVWTRSQLGSVLEHHDDRTDDYVGEKIEPPIAATDVVQIDEQLTLPNYFLVASNGNRYRLAVSDTGVLSTVLVT